MHAHDDCFYSSLVYHISLHIHMYVYGRSNYCFFLLYWGHCECLASLVGPVCVLSAVMLL